MFAVTQTYDCSVRCHRQRLEQTPAAVLMGQCSSATYDDRPSRSAALLAIVAKVWRDGKREE
jgi:hypothetical protein